MIKLTSHLRIKKLRRRKNSSGELNNSKCNDANSNDVQPQAWEVEAETSSVAARQDMPQYLSDSRPLPLNERSLLSPQRCAPLRSRAAA